jgi:uncharacterized protein (TIGR01777 family)
MKQAVLITGANGFVARYLGKKLENAYNVKFLTRNPKAKNEFAWSLENRSIDEDALTDVDYLVHLSGSKFNDGTPFTEERKKLVYDSRIGASNFLREQLKVRGQKLKSFISASAVGYYGFNDDTNEIDENGHKAISFAADLCADWESAAKRFKDDGITSRVCIIRVPVVLGPKEGVFPLYLDQVSKNPKIADQDNHEVVSWNHVQDMAGIFAFAVQDGLDGIFNSVAPQPASLQNVYQAIVNKTKNLNYEVQPFKGKHLISNKIVDAGYTFKFPEIQQAVNDLLGSAK